MLVPIIVFSSETSTLSVLLTLLGLLLIGLVLCSIIAILIVKPGMRITKDRFDNFYELFRHQIPAGLNYMTLSYYIFFLIKRATFVAILTGLREYPTN